MFTIPTLTRGRFDDLFAELDRLSRTMPADSTSVPLAVWSSDDVVAVTAEVPGVTKEDLVIEVTADSLTITGQRKVSAPRDAQWLSRERAADRFTRTITLPWRVDPDKVEARLAHGVLTVAVRRAESDKPRKIAVAA